MNQYVLRDWVLGNALWDWLSSRSRMAFRVRRAICLSTLLAILAFPQKSSAENPLAAPTHTLTTPHFVLQYDTSDAVPQADADFLEETYDDVLAFCRSLKLNVQEPRDPLMVRLYSDRAIYEKHFRDVGLTADGISGFYNEADNTAYYLRKPADPGRKADGPFISAAELTNRLELFLTISHETAHQVFFNIGIHERGADNPPWLIEGLACWFESPAAPLPKSREGYFRLADLRAALKSIPNGFEAAIESGRLLPLRNLVAAESISDWPADQWAYRYAQSWSLVHFLVNQRREAFADFLTKLSQRKPNQPVTPGQEMAEFESAFGATEALEHEWRAHVQELLLAPGTGSEPRP